MKKPGKSIHQEFPLFSDPSNGRHVYMDSAASTQKPRVVLERLSDFYSNQYANIHRGAYSLSAEATRMYEESRTAIKDFISAEDSKNIVFTKGTTEAINLVSNSLFDYFNDGDKVLVSILEHHSNIVPWELLAKKKNIELHFAPANEHILFDLDSFVKKLQELKPKLVSLVHISNAFGTLLPVAEIIEEVHKIGALVLIDAAQSVQHMPINVQDLQADFLAFSGHKIYGPTGIGVLYASDQMLDIMEPYQGGGEMIQEVSVDGSTWAEAPHKFEAGTPPIAEAIALKEAIDFIASIGFKEIIEHDDNLTKDFWNKLKEEPGVTLYGANNSGSFDFQKSIIAFNIENVHAHDFATIADKHSVQVRAGHHCAMPALKFYGIDATARLSLGVYNDFDDIDYLIEAIKEARSIFK